MNKLVLLALIGVLTFAAEGCTFFSKFADARKELEEETVKPIPVKVNTAQAQSETEAETEEEEFADLEEEAEPSAEIAGLIPATDPNARVRNSVRGRNDPFSVVTLNPRIQIEEEEEEERSNPPTNRNNRNTNRVQDRENRNNSSRQNLPEPEAVFEPTLAQDVVVSGLFQADGRTRIIVQAPEESSSRYVEVGQYLSNGQVLVKRIDSNTFPSPTVILEQAGIEVAKTIGGDLDDTDDTVGSTPLAPNYSSGTAISLK